MTFEIFAVLAILAISLVLFVTEKLRMDVVALLVLGSLSVSGLVTKEEALAGFSNPAVVTVWSMFILSAGLSATGVADVIGRQVLKLAGDREPRMIIAIMLTAGGLSAFMNNIGVAALMLPVVMDIARKTGTAPSRLLMPMAYGSLLGGLTTLIGTPPNLVSSMALREAGHEGFGLFAFAPIGVPALIIGTIFVAFFGRHLLPGGKVAKGGGEGRPVDGPGFQFAHSLEERRFRLRLDDESPLHGMALADTALAPVLGLNVVAVYRNNSVEIAPGGDFKLAAGDVLLVQGRVSEFEDFLNWQALDIAGGEEMMAVLASEKVGVMLATVANHSELVGETPTECDFAERFGVHIITVRRGKDAIRDNLANLPLSAGDNLIINGRSEALSKLEECEDFSDLRLLSEEQLGDVYPKSDRLLEIAVPEHSRLAGMKISESGLYESFRVRVVGIVRKEGAIYLPGGSEVIKSGDRILVHGRRRSLRQIQALQSLQLEDGDVEIPAEDDQLAYAEVTLAPGSRLVGKDLRELDFRRRYGLDVLSIWRGDRAYRSHLRNMTLAFGDALLLCGKHERAEALTRDKDFLILSRSAYGETARNEPGKAILAAVLMLAVVIPVIVGWLPISIAAVTGAALMVASRCLSMEDAYRAIEWKSVFLIAGMMPLGTAMQTTGAAEWVAQGVAAAAAPFGVVGVLVGLYLLTSLCTTIVPTTALVLIMAPIAIQMSATMGIQPQMMMMAIAMAASASFTSPISHPANVLVMGPGGYRFMDYVKLGVPLAIIVLLTVVPLILWLY